MPIINFKTSAPRSEGMRHRIATLLLDHGHNLLGKDRALTAIAMEYVDPSDWIIAGKSQDDSRQHSIFLDLPRQGGPKHCDATMQQRFAPMPSHLHNCSPQSLHHPSLPELRST
jgi:phenylpyruvate tautomerase PptA (4-oxalocrotonate tautomerase family)